MGNEMVVKNGGFVAPATDVRTAAETYQAMKDFVGAVLREGVDFGEIPGVDRPTLLKPGAEKLLRFFGMHTQFVELEKIEDWDGKQHGGEPFFFYRYKALAIRNGEVVAEGIGSCNSWEKKYRYRLAELVCPECGMPLRKSKHGDGYYCWAKTGGCGATFAANDPRITQQPRGNMPNPNPADLVNTIDKMSQKRALVAVALVACNASEYFTQDIEDLDFVDASYKLVEGDKQQQENPIVVTPEGNPITVRKKVIKQSNAEILEELGYDPEPTPRVTKASAATQGEQPGKQYDFKTRPFDPETLRAALQKSAPTKKPASDAQMRLLAAMLSEYYQDDTKVKEVKNYLFGVTSLKEADRQMITAALDWLNLFTDSGGAKAIDDMAKKELGKILDVVARESGQQSFLE